MTAISVERALELLNQGISVELSDNGSPAIVKPTSQSTVPLSFGEVSQGTKVPYRGSGFKEVRVMNPKDLLLGFLKSGARITTEEIPIKRG